MKNSAVSWRKNILNDHVIIHLLRSSQNLGKSLKLKFYSGAFKLYDVDRSGTISREEMENVVVAIFEMVGNHTKSYGFSIFL